MKLTSNIETLAENKVMILYILNKFENPVVNEALYDIVLTATNMNYFYFQQFLLDLLSDGFIMTTSKDNHNFHCITELGKTTLELTQDILPGIIKLKIDSSYKNIYETFEEEHSIIADYIPRDENFFNVSCKIVDHGDTIFEVKTFAASREQAKKIVDNWKQSADSIYPSMIALLTDDYDKKDTN